MKRTYKKTGIFLYSVLTLVTIAYVVMSVFLFLNLLNSSMLTLLFVLSIAAAVMMLSCIIFDRYLTCRKSYLSYIKLGTILLFSGGYLSIPVLFMGAAHVATLLSTALVFLGSSSCLLGSIACLYFSSSAYMSKDASLIGPFISSFLLGAFAYLVVTGEGNCLLLFICGIVQFSLILLIPMFKGNTDILPTFIGFSEKEEALLPPTPISCSIVSPSLGKEAANNDKDNDESNDDSNNKNNR